MIATATKFTELLMSRNATLRRATTATGMPERVRIQAPSATPPAPLAGTIEPTAISESEISNVERHDIRGQNAGRNIATYERLDSTSRRIATAIHPGDARSRIARTDPSPGASSAMSTRTTIATTTTSARRTSLRVSSSWGSRACPATQGDARGTSWTPCRA